MNLAVVLVLTFSNLLFSNEFRVVKQREWGTNSIYESPGGAFKFKINPVNNSYPVCRDNLAFIPNQIVSNGSLNYSTIDTNAGPSWFALKCSTGASDNRTYYQEKFTGQEHNHIFHKFDCYQHLGFRNYVKDLTGFDSFILGLEDELKVDSRLSRILAKRLSENSYNNVWRQLQQLHHEFVDVQQQKHDNQLHTKLLEQDFNNQGLAFIRQHSHYQDFTYRCNELQFAQLQKIALHVNELGSFANNSKQLDSLVDQSTNFTLMANNANKQNLVETSGYLLNIAKGFFS
jgi:hypothetical protein